MLFKARFTNMADNLLSMLSFVFSKERFKWFREKEKTIYSIQFPMTEEKRIIINKWENKVSRLKVKMKNIMQFYEVSLTDFDQQYEHFFKMPYVDRNHKFWTRVRTRKNK